ncbi:hypothetical protein ACFLVN_06105, partial [Chloroflexota bacterium]
MRRLVRLNWISVVLGILLLAVPANAAFGVGEAFVKVIGGGLGDLNNERVASMAIYDGYLYVGLNNGVTGGEVWRISVDGFQLGTDWIQVNNDGFGDSDNDRIRTLQVFENKLYAGTRNTVDGGQIWQTGAAGGPPFTDWTKVGGDGLGYPLNNPRVNSMATYNGDLYAGTANFNKGCQIWKTTDGINWQRVGTQGFDDKNNTVVSSMISYNNCLYVGTRNETDGVEIWRTEGVGGPPYTDWTQVNTSGFGDSSNRHAASMAVFNGCLYVGTDNEDTGTQIWRTEGVGGPPYADWIQINVDGFGSLNNIGAMSMAVSNGQLYVGTWNGTGTGELWRMANGTSWNQVPISGFTGNGRIATMLAGSPVYLGTDNPNGAEVWMQPVVPVGGDLYSVNKTSLLIPWIALAV